MKKSHSSKQWLRRHVNDPYVQRSKREGYRSRAGLQAHRDRRARPAAQARHAWWSTWAPRPAAGRRSRAKSVGPSGRVVAIDLLEMEPIPGVTFAAGRFHRAPRVSGRYRRRSGGRKADLVLSDLSPNITGIASRDQARSMELARTGARISPLVHCKPDGAFLVKVFQGAGMRNT